MDIKNKKILVAGGAGFIGSHTVDALVEAGAQVIVVDNLSSGRKENINPKVKFYKVNIASPEFEEILERERPEIIYNFSFFVFVPKSVENPLLDGDNIIGSLRMLKKIKEMACPPSLRSGTSRRGGIEKIIFASSGFLYGNTPNLPAKEIEPFDPVSPYAVAKQAIENYLKFYKKSFGLPYVILRYSAIYGPRQITGAMADYVRKLSKGEQAEIWGNGEKTRDYVYISDIIRANLLALDVSENHSEPIFNIGTGIETTLNSLYKKIAGLLKKEAKPIYYPDRPGEQMRYCLDNSKAKRELGWQPKVKLDQGLEMLLKSWELI